MGKKGKKLQKWIDRKKIRLRSDVSGKTHLNEQQLVNAGSDDFIELPGLDIVHKQILIEPANCVGCRDRFATKESYAHHIRVDYQKRSTAYVPRGKYGENDRQILICPQYGCCKNVRFQSLHEYDNHIASNHPEQALRSSPEHVMVYSSISENYQKYPALTCPKCDKIFKNRDTLRKHQAVCTGRKIMVCSYCGIQFASHREELDHINTFHAPVTSWAKRSMFNPSDESDYSHLPGAQQQHAEEAQYINHIEPAVRSYYRYFHIQTFLEDATNSEEMDALRTCLLHELSKSDLIKINAAASTIMNKEGFNGETEQDEGYLRTGSYHCTGLESVNIALKNIVNDLFQNALNVRDKGSGWSIHHIRSMEVYLVRPSIPGGGSGGLGRPRAASKLDDKIGVEICGLYNRRGLRVVQDDSGECLKSAIIYSLEKDAIRKNHKTMHEINKYCYDGVKMKEQYGYKYDWSCMDFPSSVYDLITFQENNINLNICFHVHTASHGFAERYRTRIESLLDPKSAKHVHLVLAPYERYSDKAIFHHWLIVDDFNKFQDTRYYGSKASKQASVNWSGSLSCKRCFRRFDKRNETSLYLHEQTCSGPGKPEISMPCQGEKVRFSRYERCYRKRFVAFFDVETYHTELPDLCQECEHDFSLADNESARKQIIEQCATKNHIQISRSGCKKCELFAASRMRAISEACRFNCSVPERWLHQDCNDKISPSNGECEVCYGKMKDISKKTKCDTECVGVCAEGCKGRERCAHGYTQKYTRLDPALISCLIYDNRFKKIHDIQTFAGGDCLLDFLNFLLVAEKKLEIQMYDDRTELSASPSKLRVWENATICCMCKREFNEDCVEMRKVKDHDHFTGKLRRAICSKCNLKNRESTKFNLYAHNMTGFDGNLLIRAFEKYRKKGVDWPPERVEIDEKAANGKRKPPKLSALPWNFEKFKGLNFSKWIILDSYLFQKAPLGKLADKLLESKKATGDDLEIFSQCIPLTHSLTDSGKYQLDPGKYDAATTGKGCIPYEAMTGESYLINTTECPPMSDFKSRLKEKSINQTEYEDVKKNWEMFGFKNMLECVGYYVLQDVVWLCEIWTSFAECAHKAFGLSVDHYFTLPSFAYDCCLFKTNVVLGLITSKRMYNLVLDCKRGGLTVANQRLVTSTKGKKYFKKEFEEFLPGEPENEPSMEGGPSELMLEEFILYLDANNLYGSAQTMPMPKDNFEWLLPNEMEKMMKFFEHRARKFKKGEKLLPWRQFFEDEGKGYFLKVNLKYPKALHRAHSDYPLAPENCLVDVNDLGSKQRSIINLNGLGKTATSTTKLMNNLSNREGYVLHSSTLDVYTRLGMEVTHIYEGIKFDETYFLRDWVNLCTEKRNECSRNNDAIGKDFYKLMVNSVFGKFGENLTARRDFRFASTNKEAAKLASSPLLDTFDVVAPNLMKFQLFKENIVLNRPLQIAVAVLEISKAIMYSYYYMVLKRHFGERCSLIYTDTDSLVIKIRSCDINHDLTQISSTLDTSNYPSDHELYNDSFEAMLFKFKSEVGAHLILAGCFLKAKVYTLVIDDLVGVNPPKGTYVDENGKHIMCKAKGVEGKILRRTLFSTFLKVLFYDEVEYQSCYKLIRKNYEVFMVKSRKKVLNSYDSKRLLLSCGVHTLPYSAGYDTNNLICYCNRQG